MAGAILLSLWINYIGAECFTETVAFNVFLLLAFYH